MRRAAAGLLLSLTGCGTMVNMGVGALYDHPRIYGGVRFDVVHLLPDMFPLGILFALLDLPFSIAGDTLTLPWSIPATVQYGDQDPVPVGSSQEAKGHLRGFVVEGDSPGYEILPPDEIWTLIQKGLHPVEGAQAQVVGLDLEPVDPRVSPTRANSAGSFDLVQAWSDWKGLQITAPGYREVIVTVQRLHSPKDHDYWEKHRLLIRLQKEK